METNQNNLTSIVNTLFEENNIIRIIISNPVGKNCEYKKVVFENKVENYMQNAYTEKHSFTKMIAKDKIVDSICQFADSFKQFNIFSDEFEFMVKFSKSGKLFLSKTKIQNKIEVTQNNNRIKNYIFKEGEIIPPLIDMGIYNADGKVVKSMYDKYKQINRFIELIDDYIKDNNLQRINIIDFGCGKSYLTFVVYYYFKFIKKIDITMVGLDLKADVIKKCNEAAKNMVTPLCVLNLVTLMVTNQIWT